MRARQLPKTREELRIFLIEEAIYNNAESREQAEQVADAVLKVVRTDKQVPDFVRGYLRNELSTS